MIIVRDVCQLKFSAAKHAREQWRKGQVILSKAGLGPARLMTDLVGPFYTLVPESSYRSLAEFERSHQSAGRSKAWQSWYRRFTPLVERGYREIFTVIG